MPHNRHRDRAGRHRNAGYIVAVSNSGGQPLEILSVDRRAAGLRLVDTGLATSCDFTREPMPFSPFRLAPGQTSRILLRYQVTDCKAARASDRVPLTVEVRYVDGSVRDNQLSLPEVSDPCR